MIGGAPPIRDADDAARAFEAMLLRQLLRASGAFRPTGSGAGASLHADLFVDTLAQALADAGGLGLAQTLDLPGREAQAPRPTPAAAAPSAAAPPALVDGPARLSSAFGARVDPIRGGAAHHRGIDLAAAEGTPILAAEAGVVVFAGERGGYGRVVEIDHGGGVTTLYAHASALHVAPGDRVTRGQAIAEVGATGRATGAHLHFEVRQGDRPVDPARALNAYGLRVDRGGRRGEP